MRIFHHGAYQKPDVSAAASIESTEDETKNAFAVLYEEGSLLGILLGPTQTLQL